MVGGVGGFVVGGLVVLVVGRGPVVVVGLVVVVVSLGLVPSSISLGTMG